MIHDEPRHRPEGASPAPDAAPDARLVRPPRDAPDFGPVFQVFRPVDIRVRGSWRFGVVRAWCRGPAGWLAMVEYGDDSTARPTTTSWFAYDPVTIVRLSLAQRPDAWSPGPSRSGRS